MSSENSSIGQLIGHHTSANIYDETILNYTDGYCIFDKHGYLTAYSSEFPSLYPPLMDVIKLGISYREYLLQFIARRAVQNLVEIESPEEWVDNQVERISEDPRFIHHLHDGRWVEIKSYSASTGDFFFIAFDISHYIKQQNELSQSKLKFESFASLAADWYWELDADLNYLFHSENRKFADGNTVDNCIGKSRIELLKSSSVKDQQLENHNNGLINRQNIDVILTILSVSGKKTYCRVRAQPIFSDKNRFEGYIGCGQDVTEQTLAKQQLESHARVDYLTSHLNKRAFDVELAEIHLRARQANEKVTIALIDLDRFKKVNDESGHAAGDELLRTLGPMFRNAMGGDAVIGRIGGDEFAAILQADVAVTADRLDKLREQIATFPFVWNEKTHFIGASIGVAKLDADLTPGQCLANADAACYEAKNNGRDRVVIFSDTSTSKSASGSGSAQESLRPTPDELPCVISAFDLSDLNTDTVAILMDNIHSYQQSVCKGIDQVLKARGFKSVKLVLSEHELDGGYKETEKLTRILNEKYICGVVAISSSIGEKLNIKQFHQVLNDIDSVPLTYFGSFNAEYDSIILDNESAITQLMDHLTADSGNRSFGFIRGFGELSDCVVRERAFRSYLELKGIQVDEDLFLEGGYRESTTHKAVCEMVKRGKIPDVIVAANDVMAVSAIQALQENGLKVPDDVVVTGFDDRQIATNCTPALTTLRVDIVDQARAATDLLLARIDERKNTTPVDKAPFLPKLVTTQSRLIIRQSSRSAGNLSPFQTVHIELDPHSPVDRAIGEVCRILEDEQSGCKSTGGFNYVTAFLDTLTNDTDALWPIIQSFEPSYGGDFDDHNVLVELQNAIEHLLVVMLKAQEPMPGFRQLAHLKHEISHKVSTCQAKEQLHRERSIQTCDNFQSLILQSQSIEDIRDALNSVCGDFDIDSAYLVTNNSFFLGSHFMQNRGNSLNIAYARNQSKQLAMDDSFVNLEQMLAFVMAESLPGEFLLAHPVSAQGTHLGYLILGIGDLEAPLIQRITACLAAAIVNCTRLEEQNLHTKQLKSINAELARKSNYDSITGLPNRRQYLAILEQTVHENEQQGSNFTIVHITINDMQRLSIQYGTGSSDFLIRSLSKKIEDAISQGARCFRTGSADFAIVIQSSRGTGHGTEDKLWLKRMEKDRQKKIEAVIDVLQQSYELSGVHTSLSYNIGVANYPEHGSSSDALVRNANIALQVAAERNGNGYAIYDPSLNQAGINKWKLDQQMREGLLNGEFCLFYQPRVDTKTGEILSFEALIRWFRKPAPGSKPNAGIDEEKIAQVGPYTFIPIAEETGFIANIGDFVLREACRQLNEWKESGLHCKLSINLSARELEDDQLVKRLVSTVQEHNLSGEQIEFEVTESSAMLDIEASIDKLSDLQRQGFEIAIDDFGTDYSSLNYLKRLPANYLKIDRSFVVDISEPDGGCSADAAIIKAIVTLGHSLGHKIVVEGVETDEQLQYLRSLHVDEIQGYYFSPPVDADSAQSLLEKQSADKQNAA